MKYNIAEQGRYFDVLITEFEGEIDNLLNAFRACKDGQCNCPTSEYEKLESIDVEQSGDEILLHLVAKEHDKFVRSEIEECLFYTIANS